MNKYFLSLMFILILFQSFKVSDEIFFKKKSSEKSYVIIEEDQDVNNEVVEVSEEEIPKKIDFTNLLQNASLENG